MPKRILFISTPIGPLGSGHGGGVESIVINLLPILAKRGFKMGLIAPGPIKINVPFVKTIEVMGEPAISALNAGRNSQVIVNPKGVLEKMWYTASCLQEDYDLVVSLCYDWLSFYLTPFFKIPVMHFITISSHIQAVDKMIEIVYNAYPRNFGLHTKAQAKTFGFFKENICLLPSAVNLKIFKYYPRGGQSLAWAGRISKEKGLEDAFAVAKELNLFLNVCGVMEDKKYWRKILTKYKNVKYKYHGFVSQQQLNIIIGTSKAFIATHKIVEAFGNTTLEALASGTPAIIYNLGGPAEIVEEGKSGYLIQPGQIAEIAKAVKKIDALDRKQARLRAEQYSYEKMAERYEKWINKVLKNK